MQEQGISIIKGFENGNVFVNKVLEGDLVVIQRDFPRYFNEYKAIVSLAHREGKPVVFDIDDLLFELPSDHPDRISNYFTDSLLPTFQVALEADLVTVSTPTLRNYIKRINTNVIVLPNYLNEHLWQLHPPHVEKSDGSGLIIGYMGGHSHQYDFALIEPVFIELIKRYPDLIKLYFWGMKPPRSLSRLPQVKWRHAENWNYPGFARYFQKQKVDIFVAPLMNNLFNRCKSSIKFLEYSALGVPGIYSRVKPYTSIIRDGVNGLLASSYEEWINCFVRLIEQPELRVQLAQNAQNTVKKNWLLSNNAQKWLTVYKSVLNNKAEIGRKVNPLLQTINAINQQIIPYRQKQGEWIAALEKRENDIKFHVENLERREKNIIIHEKDLELREQKFISQEEDMVARVNQLEYQLAMATIYQKNLLTTLEHTKQELSTSQGNNNVLDTSLENQVRILSGELNDIKISKTWQLALYLRRLISMIMPVGSKRAKLIGYFNKLLSPLINRIKGYLSENTRAYADNKAIKTISHSSYFDREYYLSQFPPGMNLPIDPVKHYFLYGWKEGKNPGRAFDNDDYLNRYNDIKRANICPLYHYLVFGEEEKRVITAVKEEGLGNSLSNPPFSPLVSVIVPNFNHGKYLKQRLDCIYNQTYQNIEVILLDDCSTDNSVKILTQYQVKHSEQTRLFCNAKNSSNVFEQWKKGILLSRGDLIWIAESDDYCDLNFLENLVACFLDQSVLIAYSHCIFVNENNKQTDFAFENYLSEISRTKWLNSYKEASNREVNSAFAIRNIIPNVSGAVFRRPHDKFSLFDDSNWLNMKVCGDWLFYLNLLRGGKIAYSHSTNDYYRFHSSSASKATHVKDVYYQEHETIARFVACNYQVTDDVIKHNYRLVKEHYFRNVQGASEKKFVKLYDIKQVLLEKHNHLPNVLLVTYAFYLGGGEVFPIRLANALHDKGVSVTVLNGNFEQTNKGIRQMLYPEIPVITYTSDLNLIQLVKDFGIECIHTHHAVMENIIATSGVKESTDVRHVATMHGMYEMMSSKDFIVNTKNILRSVDKWIYIADKNLHPFKTHGCYEKNKFIKIYNGMPIPEIKPIDRESLGIDEHAFVISIASRAIREKGWREAIKIISNARDRSRIDMHLLLIGEGEIHDELKGEAQPGYIHLLGFKSNVIDYFAASDVGMLPSSFKGESFPLVLIECLMAGIPVIASNIGEISRMLTLENNQMAGIVINLENGKIPIREFTDALIVMSTNRNLNSQYKIIAKRLRNKYNIEDVVKKYIKVYQNSKSNKI